MWWWWVVLCVLVILSRKVMCVCGGVRRAGERSCTSMWWMGVVAGWRARLECSERVWSWWVLKLCRAVQALYRKEDSRRSASFACADDAVGPRVGTVCAGLFGALCSWCWGRALRKTLVQTPPSPPP